MATWRGSRRRFAIDVGAGFAAGATAAFGIAAADVWLPAPTVALIGERTTQLAFLRTSDTRIAIVMGPWSDKLADALLPLLGWSKRRIDLLILPAGEQTTMAESWDAHHLLVRTMLSFGTSSHARSNFQRRLHVDQRAALDLDSDVRLTIVPPSLINDASAGPSSTPWTVMIQRGSLSIWLVERSNAASWLLDDLAIARGNCRWQRRRHDAVRPPATGCCAHCGIERS